MQLRPLISKLTEISGLTDNPAVYVDIAGVRYLIDDVTVSPEGFVVRIKAH